MPHTCVKVPVPVNRVVERPVPVPVEIDRPVDRVVERPVHVPVSTPILDPSAAFATAAFYPFTMSDGCSNSRLQG